MVSRMPRPNLLGFVVVLPACQEINIQLPTNRKNGNPLLSCLCTILVVHQQKKQSSHILLLFVIKEEEKRLPTTSYTADSDPVDPQTPNQIPTV